MMNLKVSYWLVFALLFMAPLFVSCEDNGEGDEDDIYVNIIGGGDSDGVCNCVTDPKELIGIWERSAYSQITVEGETYVSKNKLQIVFNADGKTGLISEYYEEPGSRGTTGGIASVRFEYTYDAEGELMNVIEYGDYGYYGTYSCSAYIRGDVLHTNLNSQTGGVVPYTRVGIHEE